MAEVFGCPTPNIRCAKLKILFTSSLEEIFSYIEVHEILDAV